MRSDILFLLMLNELGDEGREIAAAFDTNQQAGMTRGAVIIFKHPGNENGMIR